MNPQTKNRIALTPEQAATPTVQLAKELGVTRQGARLIKKRGYYCPGHQQPHLAPCPEFSNAHIERIQHVVKSAIIFSCRKYGMYYSELQLYGWEPADFSSEIITYVLERIGRAKTEREIINLACNRFREILRTCNRFGRDAEEFRPKQGEIWPSHMQAIDLARTYSRQGLKWFCKFYGVEETPELEQMLEEVCAQYQMPGRLRFFDRAAQYVREFYCITRTLTSNSGSIYLNCRGKGLIRVSDHASHEPRPDLYRNFYPGSPDANRAGLADSINS